MKRTSVVVSTLAALGVAAGAVGLAAQQAGPGPGMMGPGMMGHGMMGRDGPMMGPGTGMPTGPGAGMMGMGNCPMTGEGGAPAFAEGRIAFLAAELAITDAQKAVWDAYAEALRKNLKSMQGMHGAMMAVRQATSPPERLEAHLAAMRSRVGVLEEVKPALAALYAALGDEQKRKADALLTGIGCMM